MASYLGTLRLRPTAGSARSLPPVQARSLPPVQARRGLVCAAVGQGYNEMMAKSMKWGDNPYQYDFERGLYYHEIWSNLICGSQPTCPEDISYLKNTEKVEVILSLQQPKDQEYWGVSPSAIEEQCRKENVIFLRIQVEDFDGDSLRRALPRAVGELAHQLNLGKKVYVHCTAGLGRAPGTCISYLYWYQDFNLDPAYDHLTAIRPCGPKKDAIRGATYDLLSGRPFDAFGDDPPESFACLNEDDKRRLQEKIKR